MLSIGILILLIAGGLWTIFNPIFLPEQMVIAFRTLLESLLIWDGFFPVIIFFKVLSFIVFLLFLKLMFKIIMGIIALASGGGKPEIE